MYLLAAVGAALVVVSQFTGLYYSFDAENFYHRASFYPLSVLLPLCGALVDASLILQYRSRLSRQAAVSLLSYIVLPVAAAVTMLFYYGISLINIAISISMVFLFISAITEQDRRIAAQEQQLTESRISIMLSQMQPHFMYNVLNSIYYLCESDPERARDAIDKFSSYLRSNMSALEQTEQISFAEEYRHIRTYLELEQMRFGQKLQVEYDISVSSFRVPPLTVQPLVENAVRHGVTKKRGGGTVKLTTRQTPDAWVIIVADTGVGFDPAQLPQDGRTHIGLRNVQERLRDMAGGTMEVVSSPGRGTTVTVKIPKQRGRDRT